MWGKKTFIAIFLVLVTVAAAPFAYQWYLDVTYEFVPIADLNEAEFESPEEAMRYFDALEEAYRNDTYGGETPEETMDLFISALEKGDIELAARYFLIEKQAAMHEYLQRGKVNGNLDFLIFNLRKATSGQEIYEGSYHLTVVEDGRALISFEFLKNPYTNVWKIEEL